MAPIGRFFLALIGSVLSIHVLTQLWLWFAVPLGMPLISFWPMAGLRSFWGLFAWVIPPGSLNPDIPEEDKTAKAIAQFAAPFFVWAIGAAIHTWGVGQ